MLGVAEGDGENVCEGVPDIEDDALGDEVAVAEGEDEAVEADWLGVRVLG